MSQGALETAVTGTHTRCCHIPSPRGRAYKGRFFINAYHTDDNGNPQVRPLMRPTLDAQGRPVLGPDGTTVERLPPLTPHQACPQGHAAVRRPAGGLHGCRAADVLARLGVVSGGTGWVCAVGGKGRLIFLYSPIRPIRRGAKRCAHQALLIWLATTESAFCSALFAAASSRDCS